MTPCDRCGKRPAVCVVGATRIVVVDDSRDTGRDIDAPLEALGVLHVAPRTDYAWHTDTDGELALSVTTGGLQLCAVCGGRL